MRIAKYLFLLLLLSLVALSVFIATLKREFVVEKSKIINSQRPLVFGYANELKNWKDWNSLVVEDSLVDVTYSNRTEGSGSFCIWEGKESAGEIKTINQKENDSILQTINFNGNSADIAMIFKDTLGKTKVTLKAKGKLNFISKIKTVFSGGARSIFEMIFEKSLINLDIDAFDDDHMSQTYETFWIAELLTCLPIPNNPFLGHIFSFSNWQPPQKFFFRT